MSLQRLEVLSDNVLNIILYVPSPSLAYFIKGQLKEHFNVYRDFVVTVETQKAFQNAKLDSYVAPLICDKWLIHVNADKVAKKDLISGLSHNTVHGITVYWTEKYQTYMQLTDLDIVRKMSVHCPSFSFSRLSFSEITYLHSKMVGEKKALDKKLLEYVANNYRYDVQAVCDLFSMIKSGTEVTSTKEIIEHVGVGGNSVSSFVITILLNAVRGKKEKKALSSTLNLMDDLSVTYKYDTIRKFMLNNIDGFIDIKQLQIMGIYNRLNKEIPESYDAKRLSMLKRFERIILDAISLPTLLNLKLCLLKYNDFNAKIALTQAFSEFYHHSN